jgi:two-component system chemotaxis sensor kinase CheA
MWELQEAGREFLIESHENLDQLDVDLVDLEKSPDPREALGRIFRTLHTIKGSCAFLGFPRLEAVAHAGEGLLSKLRDGQVALSPAITSGLLRMVDTIRNILKIIEHTGSDGDSDYPELVTLFNELASRPAAPPPSAPSPPAPAPAPPAPVAITTATLVGLPQAAAEEPAAPDSSAVYDSSIRINVDLLDKLMGIAGEIVLARNQILQYSAQHGDPAFQNACRQLNLITTELQEHVMKTRLQPIGNIWGRFPRLVRDAALACGKKVHLDTEGSDTELDKTIIEAIRDPLTHLVRNAIDHGLEPSERRRELGKPEEGCVRLRAYHEGGQVNVEVSDDGAGIDPERIRRRALERRLIAQEQANRMSDQTLLGLIFLPGFSTAEQVTTVSGRGVGMDVVKSNIEKIGGSVDVQSLVGVGTTVRIRIPLTLAIIKVLVVASAGDRYAVPQVSIVELVRVEGDRVRESIQRVHGVLVYRYRDRLLPLVSLNRVLRVEACPPADDAVNIVVLQAADQQFGLLVDHIHDTQEIVVKPLWKHLKGISCFAGATVMGDGKVALILDVFGLAQRGGALAAMQGWAEARPQAAPAAAVERASVLLVQSPDHGRMAIPLDRVARLEEFPRSRLERVGGRLVVQHRGQILPLVDIAAVLDGRADQAPVAAHGEDGEMVQVVVYARKEKEAGHSVGLIVGSILDIVEQDSEVRGDASRPGVEYTTVIQGHVTELLDMDQLLKG